LNTFLLIEGTVIIIAVKLCTSRKNRKGKNMVTKFSGKYVVDDKGKAVSVLIDIKTYRKLIAEIEELESIRAYDISKASCDKAIPFELAVREIEKSR
jgi:hypothetical protein